jgi:hypothetical protein
LSAVDSVRNKTPTRNSNNTVYDRNKNRSVSSIKENDKKFDRLNTSMTNVNKKTKIEYDANGKKTKGKYHTVDEDFDISSDIFKKKPNLNDFKQRGSHPLKEQPHNPFPSEE